jgi:hypothetical protein
VPVAHDSPPPPASTRRFPVTALTFWLALVAAVVVPLFTRVESTALAVTTIGVSILVGAVVFVYLDSYADTRVEIERARRYLATRDRVRSEDESRG